MVTKIKAFNQKAAAPVQSMPPVKPNPPKPETITQSSEAQKQPVAAPPESAANTIEEVAKKIIATQAVSIIDINFVVSEAQKILDSENYGVALNALKYAQDILKKKLDKNDEGQMRYISHNTSVLIEQIQAARNKIEEQKKQAKKTAPKPTAMPLPAATPPAAPPAPTQPVETEVEEVAPRTFEEVAEKLKTNKDKNVSIADARFVLAQAEILPKSVEWRKNVLKRDIGKLENLIKNQKSSENLSVTDSVTDYDIQLIQKQINDFTASLLEQISQAKATKLAPSKSTTAAPPPLAATAPLVTPPAAPKQDEALAAALAKAQPHITEAEAYMKTHNFYLPFGANGFLRSYIRLINLPAKENSVEKIEENIVKLQELNKKVREHIEVEITKAKTSQGVAPPPLPPAASAKATSTEDVPVPKYREKLEILLGEDPTFSTFDMLEDVFVQQKAYAEELCKRLPHDFKPPTPNPLSAAYLGIVNKFIQGRDSYLLEDVMSRLGKIEEEIKRAEASINQTPSKSTRPQ
jgi:hypothetical protein